MRMRSISANTRMASALSVAEKSSLNLLTAAYGGSHPGRGLAASCPASANVGSPAGMTRTSKANEAVASWNIGAILPPEHLSSVLSQRPYRINSRRARGGNPRGQEARHYDDGNTADVRDWIR